MANKAALYVYNKAKTTKVILRIPAEDIAVVMRILAKNEYPFIVKGDSENGSFYSELRNLQNL